MPYSLDEWARLVELNEEVDSFVGGTTFRPNSEYIVQLIAALMIEPMRTV